MRLFPVILAAIGAAWFGILTAGGAVAQSGTTEDPAVVEPAATVCDWAVLGAGCVLRAGAVVKQRSTFGDHAIVDGFPAKQVGTVERPPELPGWAFRPGDAATLLEVPRA